MAVTSPPVDQKPAGTPLAARVAGVSVLKGLVLYGAELTFAGLYVYFIVKISLARPGHPPALDATTITAAAALAGVLGSAFALYVGTPTSEASTNRALRRHLAGAGSAGAGRVVARVRQALSLEPSDVNAASWPLTLGLWVYAGVASAVAITYVLNQQETPASVRTLAVAFGGYVIALITAAYGIQPGPEA